MSSEVDTPHSPVPVVGRRIIAREQIDVQNDIGEGEFGVVRHAVYTNDVGQKVRVRDCFANAEWVEDTVGANSRNNAGQMGFCFHRF